MVNKGGASLKVQTRVMLGEEIALGPGKADLLDAIRTYGSISAAGKHLGMSYRRAWALVDCINRCFQLPLVDTAAGGSGGGGARLTDAGNEVLADYRNLQGKIQALNDLYFPKFKTLLRTNAIPRR
jgi:molybdate transport system regulatory protein